MKKVPVYFYYLEIFSNSLRDDGEETTINAFIETFSTVLQDIQQKELMARKHDFISDEKVIWLDCYNDLGNGNFDMIFKSAKYNHIRNVIDTEMMQERGAIKSRGDGDEEKTHICIRYAEGQPRFICIHESNYYGMAIGRIIRYLNERLEQYRKDNDLNIVWILKKEIMPCDDFLEELRRMQRVSLLTITVERQNLQNDFLRFANRDDVKDTVDISIGKIKKNRYIPKSLVSEYYNDMQGENIIKRIVAEGKNESGSFRLDTELIKMKQSLDVETTEINEVLSDSFFTIAQEVINTMR